MTEQYFYRINGMHSTACVQTIEAALQALEGIEFIDIDLETGMASVKARASADVISEAIAMAGYNAVLVSE